MKEEYSKQIMSTGIIIVLVILSFFLLKPILLSIITGTILAFLFFPIQKKINSKIKSETISVSIITVSVILVLGILLWILIPLAVEQSFKFFLATQQLDLVHAMQNLFPFLKSENFSNEIGNVLQAFINKAINYVLNFFSQLLFDLPVIFLHLTVVFFTFFFVLRDRRQLVNYIRSLIPFSKEIQEKLFQQSKDITISVIYGQIIVGIVQGIIAGIGFFIFKVPNAFFMTLLAIAAGVFPIIGTTLVWIPVTIYLLLAGNTLAALGVIIFGSISSSIEQVLRPIIVSRRVCLHSSVVLIGMIGGLFLFGILGFILGPLILAYLLVLLDVYRNKKSCFFI